MNVQNLMESKFNIKSQSQIITAVLLILIAVGLAVIILNFSTNFVKDKLDSTGCFDIIDKVSFVDSNKYTCFNNKNDINPDNDEVNLKVHLGDVKSVSGLLIEIGGASTKSIRIIDEITIPGVKMYDGGTILKLPKKNEERTYIISVSGVPESIKIYPIINDKQVCEASDILETMVLCKP